MRFARLTALASVALTLLATPLAAETQQAGEPARVGFLFGASPAFNPSAYDQGALLAGLRTHGYVVGQNLLIEYRSSLGQVNPDPFPALAAELVALAALALKHRVPMVFTLRNQAEAGGLMSYAADEEEIHRQAGFLAGRILKGAKPADLPVEEPDQVPARAQPQDREGPWPDNSALGAGAGG
jgi:hypothetical protein